jgi:hypothetical protein
MKLIPICALAVATVIAGAPHAFAVNCTRPAKMSVPDGKTASEDAMKAAQGRLTTYVKGMNEYLQCLAAEIKSGKEEYESVSSEWKTQSGIFAATPAKPAQ